jgi:hypothetical protein
LAWTGPMTFEMCSFYIEQDHAENWTTKCS